eukprot:1158689-Pelagomonas_calceolata.AAC.4
MMPRKRCWQKGEWGGGVDVYQSNQKPAEKRTQKKCLTCALFLLTGQRIDDIKHNCLNNLCKYASEVQISAAAQAQASISGCCASTHHMHHMSAAAQAQASITEERSSSPSVTEASPAHSTSMSIGCHLLDNSLLVQLLMAFLVFGP